MVQKLFDLESHDRESLPACDRKEFKASLSDYDLVAIFYFPSEADKAVCSVKGKNLNDQSFCVSLIAGPALYRADWGRRSQVSEALLQKPADASVRQYNQIIITGRQESLTKGTLTCHTCHRDFVLECLPRLQLNSRVADTRLLLYFRIWEWLRHTDHRRARQFRSVN
mgnify:CR=1 FL=1